MRTVISDTISGTIQGKQFVQASHKPRLACLRSSAMCSRRQAFHMRPPKPTQAPPHAANRWHDSSSSPICTTKILTFETCHRGSSGRPRAASAVACASFHTTRYLAIQKRLPRLFAANHHTHSVLRVGHHGHVAAFAFKEALDASSSEGSLFQNATGG